MKHLSLTTALLQKLQSVGFTNTRLRISEIYVIT